MDKGKLLPFQVFKKLYISDQLGTILLAKLED